MQMATVMGSHLLCGGNRSAFDEDDDGADNDDDDVMKPAIPVESAAVTADAALKVEICCGCWGTIANVLGGAVVVMSRSCSRSRCLMFAETKNQRLWLVVVVKHFLGIIVLVCVLCVCVLVCIVEFYVCYVLYVGIYKHFIKHTTFECNCRRRRIRLCHSTHVISWPFGKRHVAFFLRCTRGIYSRAILTHTWHRHNSHGTTGRAGMPHYIQMRRPTHTKKTHATALLHKTLHRPTNSSLTHSPANHCNPVENAQKPNKRTQCIKYAQRDTRRLDGRYACDAYNLRRCACIRFLALQQVHNTGRSNTAHSHSKADTMPYTFKGETHTHNSNSRRRKQHTGTHWLTYTQKKPTQIPSRLMPSHNQRWRAAQTANAQIRDTIMPTQHTRATHTHKHKKHTKPDRVLLCSLGTL